MKNKNNQELIQKKIAEAAVKEKAMENASIALALIDESGEKNAADGN